MKKTIVIGASREQKLCSLVLAHTIQKHARGQFTLIHTYGMGFPVPKDPKNVSRTGFSFNRFAIPELSAYSGLGLYLECDQIVFDDPLVLFGIPMNGATILRPKNQPSVLLMDCEKLNWKVGEIIKGLDQGLYSYKELMEGLCVAPKDSVRKGLPDEWNSLDAYYPGKTKLLHYTNMAAQPWRSAGHPLTSIWMRELKEAVKSGRVEMSTIEEEAKLKYVVPYVASEAKKW